MPRPDSFSRWILIMASEGLAKSGPSCSARSSGEFTSCVDFSESLVTTQLRCGITPGADATRLAFSVDHDAILLRQRSAHQNSRAVRSQ